MQLASNNEVIKQFKISAAILNNQAEYIRTVRNGIPGDTVRDAIKIIGNRELFIRLFDTTSANLSRYYHKKKLTRSDTEELLDTLRVFFEAIHIWGDIKLARSWLNVSLPALAGEKPINLFDTFEGRNWVRQILRKIQFGEFS